MQDSALSGIKVVDFTTMVSGSYCAKLLADLGADVIKVEPPEGDPARLAGPFPKNDADPSANLERSGLFLYTNTSKRGVTLDLEREEDLARFKRLLAWADVLVDNHRPGTLSKLGLDGAAIHTLNPALVITCITPYGLTGPRADVAGDELTLYHAGGLGNQLPTRAVDIDEPPVKTGGYPVGYHGGIIAAFATLGALMGRMNTGLGQLVDISLQEVILAMTAPRVASTRYHNMNWSRVPDRPPAMGRMQTQDGYIIINAFDDHHFKAFAELMGNPPWCTGPEWGSLAYRAHHLMDVAPQIEEWMRGQKKDDLHHKAAAKGIAIGPIDTARDVMKNPQYAARKFFVEVEHPSAGKYEYAGWPYQMSATPPMVSRPAPTLGQHNDEVFTEIRENISDQNEKATSPEADTAIQGKAGGPRPLPLEGVRVLEFCWVWAGPYAGMLLASLGAEVIKLESHNRTDLMRRAVVWPLADPAPTTVPPNQGLSYLSVNMNVKSLTLDLATPEGMRLAQRLAAECDVVMDNMRPGALGKLGLGYEDLRKLRPDIIGASSSGRGYEGPESQYLGYAMVHHGIGGGAYTTGRPDDHPGHSTGDVDLMNAATFAYAIVAALIHRKRTGEGQFIDYSQCEGVSSLLGEMFLEYQMTSANPERMGNAHPSYAPHNVYRAWGVDRWLALEIHDDAEFVKLCEIMGQPELATDARFADMKSRKQNEEELDTIVGAWTRERDRDWTVREFCKAGLAAAPSRDGADLYADPHLRARGAFVTIDHPELGELEIVDVPWKMSDCATPGRCGPMLGEHNESILRDILGLSDAEIRQLEEDDTILAPRNVAPIAASGATDNKPQTAADNGPAGASKKAASQSVPT